MLRKIILVFAFVSIIFAFSCSPVESPPNAGGKRAIITDRTGREWEVTHAQDTYGMNPNFYNYGLGVGAIASVDNPTIIAEGEPGYPGADSNIRVFGVDHNGEQRAYSLSALAGHEVFNDIYPGESEKYLAVTF
ncbi:hypothetical protein ACFLXH_01115 [Chloroflexota bacterium]